jgi:hypothetical protein
LIGRTAVHSGKDPAFVAYDQFLSTGILQPLSGLSVGGAYASDPRLVSCLPKTFVSGKEAKRLFQEYLRQHPEVVRELAANVIAVALRAEHLEGLAAGACLSINVRQTGPGTPCQPEDYWPALLTGDRCNGG